MWRAWQGNEGKELKSKEDEENQTAIELSDVMTR